jgi:transcriptional regulator with XRE-family HTH domain
MFGENIRKVIERENMTATDAAKLMGISQPRLAQWISGKNEPSQENIKKFCMLFHTTPNFLFGFEDDITASDRQLLQAFKAMATASTGDNLNKNISEQTKER